MNKRRAWDTRFNGTYNKHKGVLNRHKGVLKLRKRRK